MAGLNGLSRRMPAEWEPQSAVLLAWPDEATDWIDNLSEVQACVADFAYELSHEQAVIMVARDAQAARAELLTAGSASPQLLQENLFCYEMPINDTWCRDFGPISLIGAEGKPLLLDWIFNGWGMKYPANHDNMISRRLAVAGAFGDTVLETVPWVLEGGSIESDGQGTILTTAQCLLDANRSPLADISTLENRFKQHLGAVRVLWLHNGRLAGDDTDGHIDTLARFCDAETIAYVATDNESDEHYISLKAMETELEAMRTADGQPYRLVPLPLPSPICDDDGLRLPATYANFLITNHSVWVPQYGVPEDASAFTAMVGLFPGRNIRGVDCLPLVKQHGALHCITMQLPAGVCPMKEE